jgi:hypothetical protein
MTSPKLKVYSDEEVDMFINQGGAHVDRLLLHGMNAMSAVLISHVEKEEQVMAAHGNPKEIAARAAWVDAQIDRGRARTEMMKKIAESSLIWAAIGALGLLGFILKEAFMTWVHTPVVGK